MPLLYFGDARCSFWQAVCQCEFPEIDAALRACSRIVIVSDDEIQATLVPTPLPLDYHTLSLFPYPRFRTSATGLAFVAVNIQFGVVTLAQARNAYYEPTTLRDLARSRYSLLQTLARPNLLQT